MRRTDDVSLWPWPLTFDLGGHYDCWSYASWYFVKVPSANLGDTTIRFRFMGHWADTAQTDHVTLRPWPLTLEVMAHVADVGRRPPCVYQVWSSWPWHSEEMPHDVSALVGLETLTFDLLTLKLACESHLRWGTVLPNYGTPGLWVLESFAMYVTDGQRQTDGRTKATLIAPFPTGWGHNNLP